MTPGWRPAARKAISVVIPEGVPEAVQPAADGFDVLGGGPSSVFGVLDQPRPSRGGVAEAGQVVLHGAFLLSADMRTEAILIMRVSGPGF